MTRRRMPNSLRSRRRERSVAETTEVLSNDDTVTSTRTRARRSPYDVVAYRQQEPITRTIWRGPVTRDFRYGDDMHVSDLIYTCVRKMALSNHLNLPMPQQDIWDGQGITFKIGEAVAEFIIDKVMDRENNIYGMWTCGCSDQEVIGPCTFEELDPEHDICMRCSQPITKYKEISIRYPEFHLVGNIDLCFMYDALLVTELKSMAKASWEKLKRPLPDHIVQVCLYWWMMREAGVRIYDSVSILYVCKEWKFGSPYKEYVIKPEELMHIITPYLDEAEAYENFANNDGPLPERTLCSSAEDTRATKCEFCNECFRLD